LAYYPNKEVDAMFNEALRCFDAELGYIKRTNLVNIGKLPPWGVKDFGTLISREEHLGPTMLCLFLASIFGVINKTTLKLGCVLQLLDIALFLHRKLPSVVSCKDLRDEIQYPVLLGDLLYSKIYAELSSEELSQNLLQVSSLLCDIHRGVALTEVGPDLIEGFLNKAACIMGAGSVGANQADVAHAGDFGYQFGLLRFKAEYNLDYLPETGSGWSTAWRTLEKMPPAQGKPLLGNILIRMGAALLKENIVTLPDEKLC